MRKIFTQSEDTSLKTGIFTTFDFHGIWSRVRIVSKKVIEDPNFNKPLKEVLCQR